MYGVYADFVTGVVRSRNEFGCGVYVGSSKHIATRASRHIDICDKAKITGLLPKENSRSLHYLEPIRDITPDFLILSIFQNPVEKGYLIIQESVFMILLSAFSYGNYDRTFGGIAAHEFCRNVRASLNIPRVHWRGMIAAFPLKQGFSRKNRKCCCRASTPPVVR
jgi:hypothetical protein